MNTIATFFAGIMAFFSSIFGHHVVSTPEPTVQQAIVVVASSSVATTENTKVTKTSGANLFALLEQSLNLCNLKNNVDYKGSRYEEQCKMSTEALHKIDIDTLQEVEGQGDYYKDKNDVYIYVDGVETEYVAALNADPSTFTAIGYFFSKDKNFVFNHGVKMSSLDARTFHLIGTSSPYLYAADVKKVYSVIISGHDNAVPELSEIIGADPLTFQVNFPKDEIYHYWSKDKNHVYFQDEIVEGLDSATFSIITDGSQKDCGSRPYVKDKNNVYWGDKKIEGIDMPTFEIIGINYSRDKNHVYYGNTIQPEKDPKTFKPECGVGLKNWGNENV